MNKEKAKLGDRKWRYVGDAILELVLSENICNLPRQIKGQESLSYLRSNDRIALIRDSKTFPITFKARRSITRNESKGDEVEYYIAFLYFNYGIDSARRFIMKNLLSKYLIK